LALALSNCMQREFERQPFIPPLGLSPVNEEFPDLTYWCRSGMPGYPVPVLLCNIHKMH